MVLQNSLEAAVQLEAFPKSVVSVNCVIMESAGSEMAVLITAAALALADAGIPMFDLVTACQVVRDSCLNGHDVIPGNGQTQTCHAPQIAMQPVDTPNLAVLSSLWSCKVATTMFSIFSILCICTGTNLTALQCLLNPSGAFCR